MPDMLCSLGSKVLAELMWILTLVDWRGTTFWRFDWIWLVDWVVSLNHWCTECKVHITASTSPRLLAVVLYTLDCSHGKAPSNTTEGMRSVISIPPAPRNNGLKQWFTRFDLKIRLLTNDGFSQREAYVGLFWSKTTMLARRLHVRLHIGPDIKSGQRLPNTGPGGRSIESFWTLTWAGLCHHEVPWSHRFQCHLAMHLSRIIRRQHGNTRESWCLKRRDASAVVFWPSPKALRTWELSIKWNKIKYILQSIIENSEDRLR